MTRHRTNTCAPRALLRVAAAFAVSSAALLGAASSSADNPAAPPSLKTIPAPEPENLGLFLRSDPSNLNVSGYPTATAEAKNAAIALGKALFWDMQVGSDGVQACATCHFHAGADFRTKNQVDPGFDAGDFTFQTVGPNGTLSADMFPFHRLADPADPTSDLLSDSNDIAGSQGVHLSAFLKIAASGREKDLFMPDPVFQVDGIDVRRAEPRHAPSVINAVFNFSNFWDGRANNIFNGSSPFGDADPDAGVWVEAGGVLVKERVRIPMSSLASQAVGPPGSNFEMSAAGRLFPDIGRKLCGDASHAPVAPLGKQRVSPYDSVLGPLARSKVHKGHVVLEKGLATTYAAMVKRAFQEAYWGSYATVGPDQYTQMEANFALFFGLSIQLYEATLVSDDSPFDRFQEGDPTALSETAQAGLDIFLTAADVDVAGGSCINCHGTPELTNASVTHVGATNFGASLPEDLIELMIMGDDGSAFYDSGFYDIGVRPIGEDVGRGGADPFGYPLSFTGRALMMDGGQSLPFPSPLLPCGLPDSPPVCPSIKRPAVMGAFKAPTLRNVELTGPYFHNGGQATLRQVIDFYARGGDFHQVNLDTLDPDVDFNPVLANDPAAKDALVDFLLSLTDERVRWEKAPFDHPELFVPEGAPGDTASVLACGMIQSCDSMVHIPAVGAGGREDVGLPPLGTFLGLDPHQP
jgi:cytochrome c peroxidase